MASHNPISRSLRITARAPSRGARVGQEGMNDWREIDRINPENGRAVTSIRDYSAMMTGPNRGMNCNADDGKRNSDRPQGAPRRELRAPSSRINSRWRNRFSLNHRREGRDVDRRGAIPGEIQTELPNGNERAPMMWRDSVRGETLQMRHRRVADVSLP